MCEDNSEPDSGAISRKIVCIFWDFWETFWHVFCILLSILAFFGEHLGKLMEIQGKSRENIRKIQEGARTNHKIHEKYQKVREITENLYTQSHQGFKFFKVMSSPDQKTGKPKEKLRTSEEKLGNS